MADFLSVDDASGLSTLTQKIVSMAVAGERKFTNGDATMGGEVEVLDIADMPARCLKKLVYVYPG